MPIIGLLVIIILPIIYGAFISVLFKNTESRWSVLYASGFVAMILALLVSTLVALKIDANLHIGSLIYFAILGIGALVSLPFVIISIRQKKMPKLAFNLDKRNLFFLVPAVILGIIAIFVYVPSYINDNTWEIVTTTLYSGSIYEYSSMTGKAMELGTAGLPIFNKINVMPLFYSYFASVFGLDMWLLGGIVVPAIVYIVNLSLVYQIAKEIVPSIDKAFFMVLYMIIMMAGTYLPIGGIPVTVGYAILREGYSGYAICYGILAPLILWWILKKRYMSAVILGTSFVSLVRIDRIVYAILEPIKSFTQINMAGKLVAMTLVSFIAAVILKVVKKEKIRWEIFMIPSLGISMVATKIKCFMNTRTKKLVYCLGLSVIIFSCVIFRPFNDASVAHTITKQNDEMKVCLDMIKSEVGEIYLWACDDFMYEARRLDGSVKLLYGRDDLNITLAGVDYEPQSEYIADYRKFVLNKSYNVDYLDSVYSDEEIVANACLEGVNTFVLPLGAGKERYESLLAEYGFKQITLLSDYLVYVRKDKMQ